MRLLNVFAIGMMMLLLATACGGGGDDNGLDIDAGPLSIALLRATPSTGTSPLRVTFTVNITGGVAPYYYAFDFTNDGAVDTFVNQTYDRTLSVQNDYFLRASDAGGNSTYECVLKVTDSSGDPAVESDPVTVVVQAGSGITFTGNTGWSSDITGPEGQPVARTGEPVRFAAQPAGGESPYSYQWDFNDDGTIDSTVASPQYTFTHQQTGIVNFIVHLTVVDNNGEKAFYDFIVPVEGTVPQTDPVSDFDIILNSDPPAVDGVVELDWAPTSETEGVPTSPELDLAIVVNPDPEKAGQPPYEYYWDFENDGKYDTQDPSPTIPYYDFERKILVNPYVHQLDSKAFTLRVLVIDGAGQMQQRTRTILSRNLDGSTGLLAVNADYGFGAELRPYTTSSGQDTVNGAVFSITVTGSPGTVQYQFDADGDGVAENIVPDADPGEPEAWDVPTNQGNFSINWDYEGIGYYPASITVRTVDTQGNQVDIETLQMPISIVRVGEVAYDGIGLQPRTDHAMAASWSLQPGGGNGQALAAREIVIAGGRRGNTSLRDTSRIIQQFSLPDAQGSFESIVESLAETRLPMNQERYNHWMWTLGNTDINSATYFAMGGEFFLGGQLELYAGTELTNGYLNGSAPWSISYEMGPGGYLELTDSQGAYVGPIEIPGRPGYNYEYVFVGGILDRSGSIANGVSRKFISFDPLRPLEMPPKPAFVLAGPDIITARFNAASVFYNNKYYVLGGRVASGESVRTAEVYDINTGLWSAIPPMQDQRAGHVAQVIGGKIYVIGGGYYPPNESDFTLVTTAEVFNPDTGTWSYTQPPTSGGASQALYNSSGVALPGPGGVSDAGASPNTIWVFGGIDESRAEKGSLYELVYFYSVEAPPAL